MSRPRWLRQWVAACREDLLDEDLIAFALGNATSLGPASTAPERLRALQRWLRRVLQFRFEGQRHQTVSIADARRRVSPTTGRPGWGCCSDTSAGIAAVALYLCDATGERLELGYETVDGVDHYAHSTMLIDGVAVDAVPDFSDERGRVRPGHSEDVRELVEWPAVKRATRVRAVLDELLLPRG